MRGILIGLMTMLVAGCGRDASPTPDARLTLELTGRFGSRDGPLALQDIRGLSVDPAGERIYVTQGGVASVLVLSSTGDSLHVLGRAGEGPGEFQFPGAAHIWNDTVWVPDYSGRVSAFDPPGGHLRDLNLSQVQLGGTSRPTFLGFLDDGSMLLEGGISIGRAVAGEQTEVALARVDRSGDGIETIAHRSLEGGFVRLSLNSGRMLLGPHPAVHWDLTCLDPRGRWLVSAAQNVSGSGTPEILMAWISSAGDTIRSLSVGIPAVSSDVGRAAWEEEFAASFELPVGQVRELGESITWPAYMPAKSLVCDHEGRTWIQLPHADPDSATWAVRGEDGAPLGTASLDARVRINAAVGDQAWGWAPGAYDEPYVVRFRLTGR